MAEPINLKKLTEEERGVLVEAIPLLRIANTEKEYYWDNTEFKRLYRKWLDTTNSEFAEGGFEQFRLAISQMRKAVGNAPLTYKITKDIKDCETRDELRATLRGEVFKVKRRIME